jgi:energy-coupling factor transporter ATP-binding protein EcfA2
MEQKDYLRFGHICRIELENIRNFEKLVLNLECLDEVRKKMIIIGRNGTGKSTLLRSLALALSPQSDATSLITSSQGSFVREGKNIGVIRLQGVDLLDGKPFGIEVIIEGEGRSFSFSRKVDSNQDQQNYFVCGYGAGRSLTGITSENQYRQIDAVGSLFDYEKRLLNTEIILRRLYDYEEQDIFKSAMRGIKRILELSAKHKIEFKQGGGVQISGPGFGKAIPIEAWADGYRLTFSWIIDLYGRAMQAGAITKRGGIRGVLLLDEIEQHLHPSMQSELINQLRDIFPELQIFATTHSPLTALGAGGENVISLQRDPKTGAVQRVNVPTLKGYTIEDTLVEEALFGTDPYSQSEQDDLTRYRELAQKSPADLSIEEADELNLLLTTLSIPKSLQPEGDTIDKKLDEVLSLLKQKEGKG